MRSVAVSLAIVLFALQAPAQELRDPTRPPRVSSPATGSAPRPARAELEAVWITPERRIAQISGREVEVGDAFRGAAVARIEPGGVTLIQNGVARVLTFTPTVLRASEDLR